MTDLSPLTSLANQASSCRDCRLGTLQVSCPKKDREGEDCAVCNGTGLKDHRKQVVWGEGKPSAQIMLVGEAPGYHEDLTGRPFYPEAPAGRVLRSIVAELGIERQVYITNVAKCRPPDNKLSAFPDAVIACRKWLDEEIRLIKPKVIVTLGAIPSARWFGGLPAHEVSTLARSTGEGYVVVGSFHPAYAARGVDPLARPSIKQSLIRAVELTREIRS